ncbi:MAG: hypothetical protein IPK26_23640 [Planctomycetes bacterium]|nr:hypothetical protein [Planctomycetota bacterium]
MLHPRSQALALGVILAAAPAQVVNEAAPAGNTQALTISGLPAAGEVITIDLQAPPGSAAVMWFATRTASLLVPEGVVLLDPVSGFGSCSFVVPPSGAVQATCPVAPFLEHGAAFATQGAWNDGGAVRLTNRCRMFILGSVGQRPNVLDLDPLPLATSLPNVQVSGRATAVGSSIRIEGGLAPVTGIASGANGEFSIAVGLVANRRNRLLLTETTPGNVVRPAVGVDIVQDATPPELHVDFPADGAELTEPTVTVAGRVADQLSGFMGLTVRVNGQLATVNIGIGTNGTYEYRDLALPAVGVPMPITVTATDEVGNVATRQITVTRIPVVGPRMEAVSGGNQTAVVDEFLVQPVVVRVLQGNGTPFADKLVRFRVTRSNGRLATNRGAEGAAELQARTDVAGRVQAYWRLGSDAGCGNNRVEVTSVDIAGVVGFCASAMPGIADQVNVSSGNSQRAAVAAPLPLPLRAWVSDSCNGVGGVAVTFQVILGDGSLLREGVPPTRVLTVTTGPTGHAEVGFALGPAAGNNIVKATIPGQIEAAVFQATGVPVQGGALGSFVGVVLDNADRPIGGATCQLRAGTTLLPAVTSNDNGEFTIPAVPFGAGHLHVDGLTANRVGGPNGTPVPPGSFPALAYEVVLLEGAVNALPGPVILPPLNPANARIYDGVNDVELSVEGIAELRMFVRAGSMRLATGQPAPPGTIIALNQVHADKVPMPMPDGAAPPFAWTLQPAGSTFDPPIRIEYPNMSGLPAGSIAYFLSFNHATEQFEIVSSAHVNADGSTIVSDAGGGLRTAGWGCNCPPYSVATNCEVCVRTCQSAGSLSGGSVTVSNSNPALGTDVTFSASGVTDSGGVVSIECPDGSGSSEPIAPGTMLYSYELLRPNAPTLRGEGASVAVRVDVCGEYVCRFTATVQRECAPSPYVMPERRAAPPGGADPGGRNAVNFFYSAPATPTGWGLTRLRVPTVDISAYCDAAAGVWRCRVTTAESPYDQGSRLLPGVVEVTAALVAATSSCVTLNTMITSLNSVANQGLDSGYYMISAVEAHEDYHVTEARRDVAPPYNTFRTTVEALSVPLAGTANPLDAATAIRALAAYQTALATFEADALTALQMTASHVNLAEFIRVEHAVVDPMISGTIRPRKTALSCP